LKARVPDVCVVMVTAFATIELAVDAMKLGATDFLRKPMTPEMLRSAVSAALAGRGRAPVARTSTAGARPPIETVTLNGFRIAQAADAKHLESAEHVFHVRHVPDGRESVVTVGIDPEVVARVARLTHRTLLPGGAFWRDQAERLLSAILWSEGKPPESGRLTVRDVSREALDIVAVWDRD